MSDVSNPAKKPQTILFVGGAMRSGTTITHRALCQAKNSNPYISESWFLHDLFHLYAWNLSRYEIRMQDQFGDRSNFANLIKHNLKYYLDTVSSKYADPEVLILKHPELTQHFLTIREMTPNSKFLVIVRDPRDVISSIKTVNARHKKGEVETPISRLRTLNNYCSYYARYYKKIFEQKSTFKDDLMFVRYEDVVSQPATTFAQISSFCGAVYEGEEMKSFNPEETESKNLSRDARMKDPVSSAFWSEMYTQELSAGSIGKYKKSMPTDDVKEIERLLEGMGKAFKYW